MKEPICGNHCNSHLFISFLYFASLFNFLYSDNRYENRKTPFVRGFCLDLMYYRIVILRIITFLLQLTTNVSFCRSQVHVQNATLAGGVAIGTASNMSVAPWGALLIGCCAGGLSTVGYAYVTVSALKDPKIFHNHF